jgi:hypothetical protein
VTLAYGSLVEAGILKADVQQQAVVQHLDRLLSQLSDYSTAIQRYREELHGYEVSLRAVISLHAHGVLV